VGGASDRKSSSVFVLSALWNCWSASLAIAKTGGAYIPLDPNYPAERLSFVLEDSGALVLLTNEGLREKFAQCKTEIVLLDHDRETIESQPIENLASAVTTGNLAYVIYTSGSTGQPRASRLLIPL